MKLRLNTRIVLTIVGLIAVLVAVLAGLLYFQFGRTMEETRKANTYAMTEALLARVEKRAETAARFLAESVANSLYHHRLDAMRELNLSLARQPDVVYVWVYDNSATIILDGTENLDSYGRVVSDPMISETLKSGASVSRVENNIMHVSVPSNIGSQVLGGVKLGVSLLDIQMDITELGETLELTDTDGRRSFFQVAGIAALFFVLVGVGFSLLIAQGISDPIERLVELTRRFGRGDFDADVAVHTSNGPSETMELERALRAMAQARKKAEAEARQSQAQSAHAARVAAVGEMATGLAHELNQPLTSISAYVKGSLIRLRDDTDIAPEIFEAMENAVAEAQRAGKIIHRIREFVQKKSVDREPRDINLVVREAVDLVRSETSWQGITVTLDLASDLPLAVIDAVQIQQVILNLLRNAMDAVATMPPARKRIHVVTSQDTENWNQVSVSDWGMGLTPDVRATLFKPFVSTKDQGLGMGLAICRSIVEAHTGRLVVSGPDKPHTTFSFFLPVSGS